MFAPKAAKSQTKADVGSARRLALHSPQLMGYRLGHDPVEQALLLQRTIGNQAMLRPLAQHASRPKQEVAPENMATLRERPGLSWDSSKIPVFPPERPNRPQAPSPLAVPPLLGPKHFVSPTRPFYNAGPPRAGTPSLVYHPGDGDSSTGQQLPLQANLEVGSIDNPLEREADATADRVMRMPEPASAMRAPTSTVVAETLPAQMRGVRGGRQALSKNRGRVCR